MIVNYADHSANERTFLAWVRTVVAIEGFGIAAARIGAVTAPTWTEVALLAGGAAVILLAFIRMRHIRTKIDRAEAGDDESNTADALLLALVAALFALFGLFAVHIG